MALATPDTDVLLDRAAAGDQRARQQLLGRHRDRLKKMIALRLDRRLVARVDPSDVVQEALADADRKLDAYLRDRPLPYYPWLRRLALERLIKLHQRHRARKRAIGREEYRLQALPDQSVLELAQKLIDPVSGPSQELLREELRRRVRAALERLSERDRTLLVLRYLEQFSTREIAAELDTTEGAVKTRHVRALARLRSLLDDPEEQP
jgi:RNA polymerase sigma-70 factor (ECF subfamily)